MKSVKSVLKNRKGSVFIEAAVVFPMMIVLIVSVIYLMMEFYSLTVEEAAADSKVFENGYDEGRNIRRAAAIGDLFHEE